MDFYGFYTGKIFDAYEYLGAHMQDDGTTFRTFAPSASRVSLIGEFNGWQELPMEKVHDGNFWEVHVKDALPGMMYKYRIYGGDGRCIDHCDPYGYGMELRPATASIIRSRGSFHFQDQAWMKKRSDCRDKPLNIYEIHFGSFRKPSDEPDAWYTYDELADLLIPHLKEAGYNYLEIMPLAEYPCDDSWGYQGTGFFSPTSRYGTMNQFKSFINACHRSGIGVILDFVPIHFAVDDYALAHYDGTALYEYPHSAVGYSEWGSCNFMHSRGEVRSFLQSAADYWLSEFHIDGLRMDAISRAIYWQGDPARGVNGNAVDFLRNMNQGLKKRYPDVILAAEDSTSFPDITRPAEEGGLGFDYKWDMGWMNDTLNYFRTAPAYRTAEYHKLTFSMAYYYQERYLLPLSHDEVVHGKATIMQKMYGDYDGKFPQARAFYMYMYAHPGKKLNFMGNEIGQLREWDEKREQDWCLLSYPAQDGFFHFMADLNHFYLEHSSLWEQDYEEGGFQWLDCHQEEKCIYAFERRSRKERLVAVFNFSDKKVDDFVLKVPGAEALIPVFSSDLEMYGGASREKRAKIKGEYQLFQIDMSPYSALYFTVK